MNPHPAVIIASDFFRGHHYGRNHPLSIPRVPLTLDLIDTYRRLPPGAYVEARMATFEELTRFHQPDYVTALKHSQASGRIDPSYRQRYNIGNFENPYFANFFNIPAMAAGGSIQAAERVIDGQIAFNPAGGMHHARADRARGVCFLNDAALAIIRLRRHGWRVLYFDMDAHHGDGVELAFEDDSDVMTVSFHMDTAYAYPRRGGGLWDYGPAGTALNLPLPQSTHDSEYRLAVSTLWPNILSRFSPDVVVLQAGTDILSHDPLGKFNISNRLFLEIVSQVTASAPRNAKGSPRLAVLGGGGYHPLALARCWTGVWSILADMHLPEALTEDGRRLLQSIHRREESDAPPDPDLFRLRLDAPLDGPVRDEIRQAIDTLSHHHPILSEKPTNA